MKDKIYISQYVWISMKDIKYVLRELTPKEMVCFGGLGCPAVYSVEDMIPKEMSCIMGVGCPSISEIRRVVPEEELCIAGMACPAIYEQNVDNYLIVGKLADAKLFGLEKKVGEGEALICVPKKLIDGMKRE